MQRSWLQQAAIVLVASLVLFTNLGGARLWDRDEPRNAGCAAEMLERGDWVVPFFNAELRAHKPVLLYWLIMSAYAMFGVGEFAARFWSAVLGVGTALATYHLGSRLFSSRVGLWAGVIVATSLMFDVAGRAATPDAALIFCSTLALLVYVLGAYRPTGGYVPPNRLSLALMYALLGCGALAKGPVGVVLPLAVIGLSAVWQRRSEQRPETISLGSAAAPGGEQAAPAPLHWRRWLFGLSGWLRQVGATGWALRPWTGLVLIGLVAGPWYAWVGWRTDGEFLRVFFLEHNLGRAAQALEGHEGSLLFYPGAILVGFFPWSVLTIPTLLATWAGLRRRDPGRVFAVCWIAVYVIVFSLARTKLPSYVTPCYPALALLTAAFLDDWLQGRFALARLWPRLAWGVLGTVGLALLVAFPLLASQYLPGEGGLGGIGLILLIGAVLGLIFVERERRLAAVASLAATALVFATALFGFGAWRISQHQENQRLLAAIDRLSANPQVGAFGCLEPTWVFYGGRPIQELRADAEAPLADAGRWKPRPWPTAREFFGDGQQRFIITTRSGWDELQKTLPPTARVLAECGLLFKKDRLLLIGREPEAARTAQQSTPESVLRRPQQR